MLATVQEIETKDLSSVITVQRRLNVIQRDLGALEDKVRWLDLLARFFYSCNDRQCGKPLDNVGWPSLVKFLVYLPCGMDKICLGQR